MGKVLEMEAAQPAASEPERQPDLEARITALEEAMSTHNHGVSPELIAAIAQETKKAVLAHLKRQLGAHLAHFLLDGMPE